MAGAWEQQLQAERDLAAARGEQYAKVIDVGPRWDTGAPLPHLISNGSRAFIVCMASDPDPDWDGTYVRVVSPADAHPSPLVVIEMWGCAETRFGGRMPEALARGIESRLATGTMGMILEDFADRLAEQPYRAG